MILPLYSKISPVHMSHAYILPPDAAAISSTDEEFDFDANLIVFTEKKKLEITAKFRRYADACYDTVLSKIPITVWPLFSGLAALFNATKEAPMTK